MYSREHASIERGAADRSTGWGLRPIREAPLGDSPGWAQSPTKRPSHDQGLPAKLGQERVPSLDSYEILWSPTQFSILVHLPGVTAAEVSVSVDPGLITISSDVGAEDDAGDHGPLWQVCRDARRSQTSRTLRLPAGLATDRWTAVFDSGELLLKIPRGR